MSALPIRTEERESPGQIAYEADVRAMPCYANGKPRLAWSRLDDIAKWSWERNPTPRSEDSKS